ncbi:hypothetical protein [Xanthomonas axonopodis]|uniref:hypothetical protein n=1 Tax=Xanthomonas axonopodis TaxID=53413 RepID=UPI001115CB4E|nr:hypothetical protein [Xanthomonas axonopodis]
MMGLSEKELRELADQVAGAMGAKQKRRHLFAVSADAEVPQLTSMQRDVLYARLADLVAQYHLGWLIRQDTMEHLGIVECLSDEELRILMQRVETAVECVHEGVPFVERGLVKGATCNWVA